VAGIYQKNGGVRASADVLRGLREQSTVPALKFFLVCLTSAGSWQDS